MAKSRECIYCDDFFMCNHENAGRCIFYNTKDENKQKRHEEYVREFYEQEKGKRP